MHTGFFLGFLCLGGKLYIALSKNLILGSLKLILMQNLRGNITPRTENCNL